MAVAGAVNAAAKAALLIALTYARKRRIRLGTNTTVPMTDIPHVRDDLVRALAGTCARSAYTAHVRHLLTALGPTHRDMVLAEMPAKPFLQLHGLETQTTCRVKLGAQGMFSANRVADHIGLALCLLKIPSVQVRRLSRSSVRSAEFWRLAAAPDGDRRHGSSPRCAVWTIGLLHTVVRRIGTTSGVFA